MRKFILVLISVLLVSCESQSNKMSRLTIDKYSRKLVSIIENIVTSRKEEGSQSRITLNSFYERYTSKIEEFSNDLNFETISPKYKIYRDYLLQIAKEVNKYLSSRKSAINNMSDALSAYESLQRNQEDYVEYKYKQATSEYSSDLYSELSLKSLTNGLQESINFINGRRNYFADIAELDSTYFLLDSLATSFNTKSEKSKLEEKIKIPATFRDTINDWLISEKKAFLDLHLPEFK